MVRMRVVMYERTKFVKYGTNACMCGQCAQLRHSYFCHGNEATNKLVSVCNLQVSRCRPAAPWTERLRDSPVPWHCRARCQHISFKAAAALRKHAQQEPGRFQCDPARPCEVSRRKSCRIFIEMYRFFSREYLEMEENPATLQHNVVDCRGA